MHTQTHTHTQTLTSGTVPDVCVVCGVRTLGCTFLNKRDFACTHTHTHTHTHTMSVCLYACVRACVRQSVSGS